MYSSPRCARQTITATPTIRCGYFFEQLSLFTCNKHNSHFRVLLLSDAIALLILSQGDNDYRISLSSGIVALAAILRYLYIIVLLHEEANWFILFSLIYWWMFLTNDIILFLLFLKVSLLIKYKAKLLFTRDIFLYFIISFWVHILF